MPPKKQSLKDKIKGQMKKAKGVKAKAATGTSKDKKPAIPVTISQAQAAEREEKRMREFLKGQKASDDDTFNTEVTHFVSGSKIPVSRKKLLEQLLLIPGSIRNQLIEGYLAQNKQKAAAYYKSWTSEARAYKAWAEDETTNTRPPKAEAGAKDYAKYLAMQEELDEQLSKPKKVQDPEMTDLFGLDDDEVVDVEDTTTQEELISPAISRMLETSGLRSTTGIPVRYVDKTTRKELGRGTVDLPKKWLEAEEARFLITDEKPVEWHTELTEEEIEEGRSRPLTQEEKEARAAAAKQRREVWKGVARNVEYDPEATADYLEKAPWSQKRMGAEQNVKDRQMIFEKIATLEANINDAWIKLEDMNAWNIGTVTSNEGKELADKLTSLYELQAQLLGQTSVIPHEVAVLTDEERKARVEEVWEDKERVTKELGKLGPSGEAYRLQAEINEMQRELKELELRAPMSTAMHKEISACARIYKQGGWLKAKLNGTYLSGTDDLMPIFASVESEPINKDGVFWYPAKSTFFELQCTSKGKSQEGTVLTLPIPRDLSRDIKIWGRYPKFHVTVGYDTNRGFVIQDENVYEKEVAYFRMRHRSAREKIQEMMSEFVTTKARQWGRVTLANALQEAVNSELKDQPTSARRVSYTRDSPLVKTTIYSIAHTEDGEHIVDLGTFARRLGEIVINLGPSGSKIFSQRVATGHYSGQVPLDALPNEERNPEVFDNADVPQTIIDMQMTDMNARLNNFVEGFVEAVYVAETGERVPSRTVDIRDPLQGCQNFKYLVSEREELLAAEEGKPTHLRKRVPSLDEMAKEKFGRAQPRDIVHYMEEGELHCFTVQDIQNMIQRADDEARQENAKREEKGLNARPPRYENPITKKPLSSDFVDRFIRIYMNKAVGSIEPEGSRGEGVDDIEYIDTTWTAATGETFTGRVRAKKGLLDKQMEEILAPGLVERMLAGIAQMKAPLQQSDTDNESDGEGRLKGGGGDDWEGEDSDSDGEDYSNKCRYCSGELSSGGKGCRTLWLKEGASKDATGTNAFVKYQFCCRYCTEDFDKFDER